CGLFFSASCSRSARGVTTCVCCGAGSCANVSFPRTARSSRAQRILANPVPEQRGGVFHFASKDIFLLLNVVSNDRRSALRRQSPQANRWINGTIKTEKEPPVHSRTVQERLRSGGRNEA